MEACSRWKRLIMVNSMQANEAPQERMSAAWRLHKRGYEPRRGSVMVKTIDATTTDRLRRSPLYLDLSPSCARKRACMELTTICRFQRLLNPSFRLFQCFRRRHVPTLWRLSDEFIIIIDLLRESYWWGCHRVARSCFARARSLVYRMMRHLRCLCVFLGGRDYIR